MRIADSVSEDFFSFPPHRMPNFSVSGSSTPQVIPPAQFNFYFTTTSDAAAPSSTAAPPLIPAPAYNFYFTTLVPLSDSPLPNSRVIPASQYNFWFNTAPPVETDATFLQPNKSLPAPSPPISECQTKPLVLSSNSGHGASSIFASNPSSCQALHFGTSATSSGFSSNPFGPTLTPPSPFGAPSLFGSTGGPPPSPPPPGAGAPSFEEERWNFATCQHGRGTKKRTTNSFTLAPNPTEDFAGDKLADDIEEMMPRLRYWDYYIKPKIEELVRRERANPGFCQNVNDCVIGQHRYGSIKFLGPTDVRWLDIESVVQFKDQEVAVYKDEHKKPAVGKGLNKPAEITLLNVKCVDSKTGKIHVDGPRVDDYERILKKAAADRGAEFVSFDPVKGEWKTRVHHF